MSVDEIAELARLAEDIGYDDLWILDQSFHHDPFLLVARCAAATSTLRLGVAVTNPVTRHPIQIARAAATLAEIAGDRFVLGLGAGNRTRVLPALGLPTDRAAVRIAEAVDACRRLLAGEEVSVHSETLTLRDVRLETPPTDSIPIFVGGRGPSVLRLAGAVADGAFIEAMFTPLAMDYALGEIARGRAETNRDSSAIEVVAWQALRLSTTVAAADEERYRRWAALLMRSTRLDVLERIGVESDSAVRVRDALAAGGEVAAARVIPADVVERLILTGDPDHVAAQLARVGARGIDSVSIIGFGNTDVIRDTLRRFALDVIASGSFNEREAT
jgi:5,10-methylenetetrahydromethanopterin reductase